MKKLFSFIAVFVFALSCGVIFAACGSNPNNERKGVKCYVEVQSNPAQEKQGVTIEYGTTYNGIDTWCGVEGDEEKFYFIKGDVVHFKAYCLSEYYYADSDFKLVINDEEIELQEQYGQIYSDLDGTYYTCDYTIQEDIQIDYVNLKERTATATICVKAIEDEINYFTDNTIKVKFEDESIFGLEKADWGLTELKNYILSTSSQTISGEVGADTGTYIYFYSEGYSIACPYGLTQYEWVNGSGDIEYDNSIAVEYCCYVNDEENQYGYKVKINPIFTYQTDLNSGFDIPDGVDPQDFKGGKIMLDLSKNYITPATYGELFEKFANGFTIQAPINQVSLDNSIFSVKFGNSEYGDNTLPFNDFVDGELQITIKLHKYSDPTWKTLYDNMKIGVGDYVLTNGTDYTISSSGILTMTLKRPFEYHNVELDYDEEFDYYRTDVSGSYMYDYLFQFNIIKDALDAGLVLDLDYGYYNPDALEIYMGSTKIDCALNLNVLGYDMSSEENYTLVVKGDESVTYIDPYIYLGDNATYIYNKVRITYEDETTSEISMKTLEFDMNSEGNTDEEINNLLNSGDASGTNAVVRLALKYADDTVKYNYYLKIHIEKNITKIEFLAS